MPQDHESGSRAAKFGRENAARIARAIGAQLISTRSNLASHQLRRVALKSARVGNNFIGIPYTLVPQVSAVIAALEEDSGRFILWELPIEVFKRHEKPQKRGTVGQIPRTVFFTEGKEIGEIRNDT